MAPNSDTEEMADAIVSTIKAALKATLPLRDRRIADLERSVAELKAQQSYDAGTWKAGVEYRVNALVSYDGSGWICSKHHFSTGKEPDHTAFRLFVKHGRDGRDAR
jgi:hypothetical protein